MADSVNSADESMVSLGDFDSSLREVELLSDEELYTKLKTTGKEVGPVVDTTRKLYQKQLATLLSSPNSSYYSQGNSSINSNVTNGSTNGFSDSEEDDATFETSSRTSRSSRSSSTVQKIKKAGEALFTPKLRSTKEVEAEPVKKNLDTEDFVSRRESTRPKRTFEEYVAESEAKKALYGNAYLRKDLLPPNGQQNIGSNEQQVTASSYSTPLWIKLALVAVLIAIFAIVYYSYMEKKSIPLDQNSIIEKEIEELTKE